MSSLRLKDQSTFQVYCIKKILCGELEPDRFIFKRVKNHTLCFERKRQARTTRVLENLIILLGVYIILLKLSLQRRNQIYFVRYSLSPS